MQRGMERVEELSALQVCSLQKLPLIHYSVKLIYSHPRPPYFDDFFLNKYIFYRQGLKAIEKGLNELIH